MNAGRRPQLIPALPAEEMARRLRRDDSDWPALWSLLDAVKDPEIPVVSIWDLGILQDVECSGDAVRVTITPTYSGCPAMETIREDILTVMAGGGHPDCEVVTRLSPAWSSGWIVPAAREALRAYGIAPPAVAGIEGSGGVACPRCNSPQVSRLSEFGSTACKALYQCGDCSELFDYFKPI